MAPRHGFLTRLILLIAVLGCLVGSGHACAAAAETSMDHAMPVAAHADHAMPTAGDGTADTGSPMEPAGHEHHASHGTDCCAASLSDGVPAVTALPAALDHVAVTPPAETAPHAVAPAPPQARPPDLCSLCVQRT